MSLLGRLHALGPSKETPTPALPPATLAHRRGLRGTLARLRSRLLKYVPGTAGVGETLHFAPVPFWHASIPTAGGTMYIRTVRWKRTR